MTTLGTAPIHSIPALPGRESPTLPAGQPPASLPWLLPTLQGHSPVSIDMISTVLSFPVLLPLDLRSIQLCHLPRLAVLHSSAVLSLVPPKTVVLLVLFLYEVLLDKEVQSQDCLKAGAVWDRLALTKQVVHLWKQVTEVMFRRWRLFRLHHLHPGTGWGQHSAIFLF